MRESVRNYELKGRGVECRGADFLVKRDTTSTTAAIVVSRRCFISLQLLILQLSCRREGFEAPFGPERRGVKGGGSDGSLLSSGKVV